MPEAAVWTSGPGRPSKARLNGLYRELNVNLHHLAQLAENRLWTNVENSLEYISKSVKQIRAEEAHLRQEQLALAGLKA